MKIYKFELRIVDEQIIGGPELWVRRIRSVQFQKGKLFGWAEVLDYPGKPARVYCFGTGNPMPDEPLTYISTVQDGDFVWHFYQG
jgi:hypothetical protein